MTRVRWDDADEFDQVVLLAAPNGSRLRAIRELIARIPGTERARTLGRYPRYRVVVAGTGAEARRRARPGVTVAAVDLTIPGEPVLDTIRALRAAHPALAILAFGSSTDTSDAIASVMSGADFFHECADDSAAGFDRALELAFDRRRLTHEIERTEAEMAEARGRLAQLSGELVQAVPGFRPLEAREDVLPFREAARRYLLAAAKLFARDPRGLARALGVSYFALRRLLARYDVPFPAARQRRRR
jgi:DNA-binding NarL/FixJ family response regulator